MDLKLFATNQFDFVVTTFQLSTVWRGKAHNLTRLSTALSAPHVYRQFDNRQPLLTCLLVLLVHWQHETLHSRRPRGCDVQQ